MMTPVTPSLLSVLRSLLIRHEGMRLHVYPDSRNIPTIGIGFNLQRPDARSLCAKCGADYDALLGGTASLTQDQCDYLYRACVIEVIEDLASLFPNWKDISVNRQAALCDMRFNLGPSRFREFHHMICAVKMEDWPEAVTQMLDSDAARELTERYEEDAHLLAQG